MTRADPTKQRFPNLTGILMVDTIRGRVRVRAWPKKRGRPKSAAVRSQNDWFKAATRKLNDLDPGQMRIAIEAAKGSGFYPRDLLMNAMSGGMIDLVFPDGQVISSRRPFLEDVMFQGCILNQDTVQSLPGGGFTPITFPLPVLDTAGFWNVAKPTIITIPENVAVARFTAGWRSNDIILNGQFIQFLEVDTVTIARFSQNVGGWPGGGINTGPRVVSQGQEYRFLVYVAALNATQGNEQTFFQCEVLETS